MANEYIETLISYVRDYLLAESVRIMSSDYQDNTFDYYKDEETGEMKKLPLEVKDEILTELNQRIEILIKDLEVFLIDQNINSPKDYDEKSDVIKDFIDNLVEKQIESIELLMEKSEGSI